MSIYLPNYYHIHSSLNLFKYISTVYTFILIPFINNVDIICHFYPAIILIM